MARYSEQLELEADRTRAQLANTLDEIRARLSPGQFVDQLVDYTRDGGMAEFTRNLGRDIRNNPLPLALIGAGVAWMMMKNAMRSSESEWGIADEARAMGERGWAAARENVSTIGERMAETIGAASEAARETAENLTERAKSAAAYSSEATGEATSRVSEAASRAGQAAASLKDRASTGLQSAAEKATDAAQSLKQSASSLGQETSERGRAFLQFCQDQPLVLAGLGIAAGAALGALLPSTETENRLMGETSDQAKERIKQVAAQQYDKAREVAAAAASGAQAAASREGLGRVETPASQASETAVTHH